MNCKYPSYLLRIGGAWVEGVKSLGRIHGQIVAATERALQRLFSAEGSLVPIPIRTDVGRRRLDLRRSRD